MTNQRRRKVGVFEVREFKKPVYEHLEGDPVYVRFGFWESWSYNHATGERESGVSVYRGRVVNGAVELAEEIDSRYLDIIKGRFAFPVTGAEIGIGSDDEPVLRHVKVLALPLALSVAAWNHLLDR